MKKILSIFICIILAAVLFSFTVFAEELKVDPGDNYDFSHNTGCCDDLNEYGEPVDSSHESNHYNEGYNDGYTDGLNGISQSDVQSLIDSALNAYKQGEGALLVDSAFQSGLTQGVNNFKASTEFESMLKDEHFNGVTSGYSSGYSLGYDEAAELMYVKGEFDGFSRYTQTEEYKNALNSSADYGYKVGYKEGHHDGVEYTNNSSGDVSRVISLIVILFVFVLILFFLSNIKAKGRKRK